MEFDRAVQVRLFPQDGTEPYFGSGYLIAPRLVLTAAHILGDAAEGPSAGRVTVRAPSLDADDPNEVAATVAWYRRADGIDAALLEIPQDAAWDAPPSLRDAARRPPQRWGRLVGYRPHPVSMLGFPRMQRDPGIQERSARQFNGAIDPGNQAHDGRLEIAGSDPVRPSPAMPGDGTAWSGMSGAAVLADAAEGDLLVGVARHDLTAVGGTILTATPASRLLEDERFRALIAAHGPGLDPFAEPAELAHLLAPTIRERAVGSVAGLLRADLEVVTFQGREAELSDLRAWCEEPGTGMAVRVLLGPGGQGKTRLARRLISHLSRAGWAAGDLRSDLTDFDLPQDLRALRTRTPLLLVIDYAETRPRLVRRVLTELGSVRQPVRVLLLARADGPWRTDALAATAHIRDLLAGAQVTELAALFAPAPRAPNTSRHTQRARTQRVREQAFARASRALARLLSHVPGVPACDWSALAATLRPPRDLSDPRYENALTLQVTALTNLLQRGPAPAPRDSDAPAEEVLLAHEARFWQDSAESPAFRLALPTATLSAVVAIATLCPAATHGEAERVLATVPDLPAGQIPRTIAWLAQLYPAEPGRTWGPLQPDRIAEHHAARVVMGGDVSAAVLAAGSPAQQASFITVLARAATAHYAARRTAQADEVLRTTGRAVEAARPGRDALAAAYLGLPYGSHLINGLALQLATMIQAEELRLLGTDPFALSNTLGIMVDQAVLLYKAGRNDEALAKADTAVRAYRRLMDASQPVFVEPHLATALLNQSLMLSRAGRRADAVAASEQAARILRRRAETDPEAFESTLAKCLANLGNQLAEVGRHTEALAADREALGIRSRIAQADPAGGEPELARSLVSVGIRLSEAGQHREAVASTRRALVITRRLAASDPGTWEPELANCLSNLGVRLAETRKYAQALAAESEALEIRRRLAARNPEAYNRDLADSLSNLAVRLKESERWPEALEAAMRAAAIQAYMIHAGDRAIEPDFAQSLSNIGVDLAILNRRDEALGNFAQALEIYRRLSASEPAAFEPLVARTLLARSVLYLGHHEYAEGLADIEEAAAIYSAHRTVSPALASQLRGVQLFQAEILERLGRNEEAGALRRAHAEPDPR